MCRPGRERKIESPRSSTLFPCIGLAARLRSGTLLAIRIKKLFIRFWESIFSWVELFFTGATCWRWQAQSQVEMKCDDTEHIYLIDHSWTYRYICISTLSTPPLLCLLFVQLKVLYMLFIWATIYSERKLKRNVSTPIRCMYQVPIWIGDMMLMNF